MLHSLAVTYSANINSVFSCGHAAMAVSYPVVRNQQLVFFVQ